MKSPAGWLLRLRARSTPGAAPPDAARPRVLRGLLWAMAGALCSQGSVFASSIVAARVLGQAEFGKLAMLQSAVATVGGFAAVGLGTTATKFVAELCVRDPARAGRILGLCTLVTTATGGLFAMLLLVAAPWAATLFHIPGLEAQLRWGALYVLFFTMNTYQLGALSGFSAFAALARIGLVQGLVAVALLTLGAVTFGLTGAAVALAAAALCSWLQHQRALRHECARYGVVMTYASAGQELSALFGFALPAALSGCVGGLAFTAASTVLIRQPDGVRQMAIFSAANTIRIIVLFVPGLVSRVSTPLLCGLRGNADDGGFRLAFSRFLLANTAMAVAAAVLLFACAPWVLALYGRDFANGRPVLGLLLASAVVETVAVALFQTLYAHGRVWLQLGIVTVWSLLLVGLVRQLAADHGASGLAAAYLCAWTVSALAYGCSAWAILRRDKISPSAETLPDGSAEQREVGEP